MNQFRIVYDLHGGRGAVYVLCLSRVGAERLFLASFPEARVVRLSEVRP